MIKQFAKCPITINTRTHTYTQAWGIFYEQDSNWQGWSYWSIDRMHWLTQVNEWPLKQIKRSPKTFSFQLNHHYLHWITVQFTVKKTLYHSSLFYSNLGNCNLLAPHFTYSDHDVGSYMRIVQFTNGEKDSIFSKRDWIFLLSFHLFCRHRFTQLIGRLLKYFKVKLVISFLLLFYTLTNSHLFSLFLPVWFVSCFLLIKWKHLYSLQVSAAIQFHRKQISIHYLPIE